LDLESLQPTTETQYVAPRNEVEQGIADIWKDVLGAERVGMNDNFFELGGNSLLTTQVMARVRRTFEVDVPLRKLFEGATVAELALQVRGRSDKFSDRLYEATFRGSLVPMQPNGTRTPLFLVSGAHAEEEEFLRFVGNVLPHLLDQPIYGFKSRGLDGLQPPHDSTREMATDYIKEMREVQPEGPYLLAGECVGGIVAFEMAQQLREQGHEVGLVALLDSARPTDEYFEFLTRYLGHARRQRGRERLKNHLKKLLAMSLPEQIRYASSKIRSKLSKTVPLTKEQRRLKRGRSVEDYYLATNYSYRPRPYHGKLTLVYSKAYLEAWKDAGWKEIAVGGLEIREVPGDHVSRWTIYSKENAAVLRSCLDDAVKEARKRPAKHTTKAKAKSRAVAQ
jgi:thioesterase domain-containing protein/acyl carrier protein